MQQDNERFLQFKKAIGIVAREVRELEPAISMTKLAHEYEINKGTLSLLEKGLSDCRISTLWLLAEAKGIKFSELAKRLENKLGKDFKLIEE